MKTTIIAVLAVALISAAPAAVARHESNQIGHEMQHKVAKKHFPRVSGSTPRRQMESKGSRNGYPRAFRYKPAEPNDYTIGMPSGGGDGGGGGGY